jgi:hypothetical protein
MRKVLVGTLLVVGLAAAGCGGGSSPNGGGSGSNNGEASKSAQQVLADAKQAAEAASSLHYSGQITTGGRQVGIDLTVVKGKGATGSVTLDGHKVDIVVTGGDAYMKADAAFWTQFAGSSGSTVAQMFANKWLKFPTSNPQFAGFTNFTDSKTIFGQLSSKHGTITNDGATTYKGQSVVAIRDKTKGGTFYVAGTGTAYPVALVKTGNGSGAITFDSWNKSVTLTAPSGAIDLSQLTGSSYPSRY